jgi:biotin carboxylase
MIPSILLVENGPYEAKRELVQSVVAVSDTTLLINSGKAAEINDWHKLYFRPEKLLSLELSDPNSVAEALSNRGEKFDGIVTFLEEAVPVTQAIQQRLGLPQITHGDIRSLRNKELMRDTLEAASVNQPKYIPCETFEQVMAAIKTIGLPCIIKPAEMGSSLGVHLITKGLSEKQVKDWFDEAKDIDFAGEFLRKQYGLSSKVLIEEFIEADLEVSVEGIAFQGVPKIAAVTRKFLGPRPEFEEIGHSTPISLPQQRADEVADTIKRMVSGLKLHNTVFHAELRFPKDGEAVFIEVGGRQGGDRITTLLQKATGINLSYASVDVAANREPHLVPQRAEVASIVFINKLEIAQRVKENIRRLSDIQQISEVKMYGNFSQHSYGHIEFLAANEAEIDRARAAVIEIIGS